MERLEMSTANATTQIWLFPPLSNYQALVIDSSRVSFVTFKLADSTSSLPTPLLPLLILSSCGPVISGKSSSEDR